MSFPVYSKVSDEGNVCITANIATKADMPRCNYMFDSDKTWQRLQWLRRQGRTCVSYKMYVDDTYVGYAFLSCDEEEPTCLEFLELKPGHKRKGYGSILLNYFIANFDFYLEPVFGSIHWYLSKGAKPVLWTTSGIHVVFTKMKPSEYYSKFFAEDDEYDGFEFSDDFVYIKKDWDRYASLV